MLPTAPAKAQVCGLTVALCVAFVSATSSEVAAQTQPANADQGRTLAMQANDPKPLPASDGALPALDLSKSLPGVWSTVDINCATCVPGLVSMPSNPNAPWSVQGRVRHENRLGTFSGGFLGVRNYAPPLYTALPIGGAYNPGGASSSLTNFFVPSTQWHLTAAFQRRLLTSAGGATLDLTADVIVPIKTDHAPGDHPRIDSLPSRAVRVGFVYRW